MYGSNLSFRMRADTCPLSICMAPLRSLYMLLTATVLLWNRISGHLEPCSLLMGFTIKLQQLEVHGCKLKWLTTLAYFVHVCGTLIQALSACINVPQTCDCIARLSCRSARGNRWFCNSHRMEAGSVFYHVLNYHRFARCLAITIVHPIILRFPPLYDAYESQGPHFSTLFSPQRICVCPMAAAVTLILIQQALGQLPQVRRTVIVVWLHCIPQTPIELVTVLIDPTFIKMLYSTCTLRYTLHTSEGCRHIVPTF